MKITEFYIKRCIELAENGLGSTYPNPMVGSVIVHNNEIIGEGWHRKAGEPHAEVHAINSVKNKSLLKQSTIYVSLEPCSHFGKTPPCSDLIISSGIKNVVIGAIDPFVEVGGRGVKKLMEAGCKVTVGVLEQECQHLNKRFFTFHNKKRPYIILKWAESADGHISPASKDDKRPVWITNQYSRQLVHKWRSEEQSILVGTNTVVADNPTLNTRDWMGHSPIRIVLDKNLRIPKDYTVWNGSVKTIFLSEIKNPKSETKNTIHKTVDFTKNIVPQICDVLYQQQIQSVIIEGGTKTLQTFIDTGLWDEARVFTANVSFRKGTKAPIFTAKQVSEQKIMDDTLRVFKNGW